MNIDDDDIRSSETLLVRADAFLQRHKASFASDPDDDLPMLDDIVGEELPVLEEIAPFTPPKQELPQASAAPAENASPARSVVTPPFSQLAEFNHGPSISSAIHGEFNLSAPTFAAGSQSLEGTAVGDGSETNVTRAESASDAWRTQLAATQAQLARQNEMLARQTTAYAAALTRATTAEEATERARIAAQTTRMAVAEQLINFDAHIAQTLEAWISNELPQLIASELDGMVERLRIQTQAHMRATLIPQLSAKLAEVLDATVYDTPPEI
ncbi:MAG: hypothetical protein FWD62_13820 [Betaproteobacteria bacterium]|nr:hypothetical protein [Betaproteobacteria bacterium]